MPHVRESTSSYPNRNIFPFESILASCNHNSWEPKNYLAQTGGINMPDVNWPRIKEILNHLLIKWQQEHGREPKMKVVHEGHIGWETKEELAQSNPYGKILIEPDKVGNGQGAETNLVRILTSYIGGYRRMPSGGPYLSKEEIDEIRQWIDAGMPD